jgi:hypothetical protein
MRFLLSSRDQVLDVHADNGDVDVQRCFAHPAGQNIKCLATTICFGTTAGAVWTSADGGDSWRELPYQFPAVNHLLIA